MPAQRIFFVMRGIDPRIHAAVPRTWLLRMDCRVKLGSDEEDIAAREEDMAARVTRKT